MRPLPLVALATALVALGSIPEGMAQPEGHEANEPIASPWRASAQAGLMLNTGNSSASSLTGDLRGEHTWGANQVALRLAGAFARSAIYLANDEDGDGVIAASEVERITSTTSQSWLARARYERGVTERNAIYAASSLAGDKPAGKELVAGGQLGYSRTLVETREHQLAAETGYDFTHERLSVDSKGLRIHSLRAFVGYEGKLSPDTRLLLSSELLVNLNRVQTPRGPIERGKDTRSHSEVSLTTALSQALRFRFAFIADYDNSPAPRPATSLPYAVDFLPYATRLDTRTEVSLVIDFF